MAPDIHVQAFQYNDRVALAIVPSLIVFCSLADAPVLAMMVVGTLLAYMLDAGRVKELAIGTVWGTLALANLTDIIGILVTDRHITWLIRVLAMMASSALLFLVGAWASLQFRFLPLRYPVLALVFENVLLTGAAPIATMYLSWALFASVGAYHAPFYTAIVAAACTAAFVPPLPSSYRTGAAAVTPSSSAAESRVPMARERAAAYVQSRVQAAMLSLFAVATPAALYAAVHFRHLHRAEHLWSFALLLSGALLFQHLCPRALWWLPPALRTARLVTLGVSFFLGIAALEQRVVLVAFAAYVKLPPVWAKLVIAFGMYAGGALTLLYFGGYVPYVDPSILGVICIAVATAAGLAFGLPFYCMPVAIVSGAALALYQDTPWLSVYATFVAGALVCFAAFLRENFWFLDIVVGGLHIRAICVLIGVALAPALQLPGLVQMRARPGALFVTLLGQSLVLALLEEVLHVGDAGESFYPAYLVCATSVMGIAIVRRLAHLRFLSPLASWAVQCVYAAKLATIALPEARLTLPLLSLLWAATPPLFPGALPVPTDAGVAADTFRRAHAPLKRAHGLVLAVSVVTAVVYARFAVFDVVQALHGGPPPEGVLLGALLAVAAAALAPLVYRCYPYSVALKRYLFLLLASAAMFAIVQPPLPIAGGAKCPRLPFHLCPRLWDERHVPDHAMDDVNIYGEALAWREHWTLWLLIAAAVAGMLAASMPKGRGGSLEAHLALGTLAAILAGAYLGFEFLPGQFLVQCSCVCLHDVATDYIFKPFIVGGTLSASLFLVLLHSPRMLEGGDLTRPQNMSAIPAVWIVLFSVALVIQAVAPLPELPVEAVRLFPGAARSSVDEERRRLSLAAVSAIIAAQGLLLALVVKLKVSAIVRGGHATGSSSGGGATARGVRPTAPRVSHKGAAAGLRAAVDSPLLAGLVSVPLASSTTGKMLHMTRAGQAGMARLGAQGLAWLPTVGNVMTVATFILTVALNFQIGEGRDEAVLALAAVLLLLSHDPVLFPWLDPSRRYLPPLAAMLLYLATSALRGALAAPDLVEALAIGGGLVATLPSHVLLCVYLWNRRKQSEWPLLFCTPLNLGAALVAGPYSSAVNLVAGLAVIGAVCQGYAMRSVKARGSRLI